MRLLKVFWVLGLFVCFQAAQAAVVTNDLVIYNGTPLSDAGISVSAWGSGDAAESTLRGSVLDGRAASIRVFSDNLYSGGRIEFAKGVKLYSRGAKTVGKYLVFVVRFAPSNANAYGAGAGFWNTPGSTGTTGYPRNESLRFVFVEEGGSKTAAIRARVTPAADGWMNIGIPVSKLTLPENRDEYVLKSVVVAAEATSQVVSSSSDGSTGLGAGMAGGMTPPGGMGGAGMMGTSGTVTGSGDKRVFQTVEMNIGQIKTVLDNDTIKCDTPKQIYNPRAINEVLVSVEADGGMAALKYTWDFGDDTVATVGTNQGIHIYAKPGDYKITLTISDKDGVKESITRSLNVKMEW